MITERIELGRIEVLPDGQLQLREDRVILEEDGVTEITRTYHRRVLEPTLELSDDVKGYPDARLLAVTTVLWTPDVVKAYEEKKKQPPSVIGAEITPVENPQPIDAAGQKPRPVVD
jgi:hypothetical protein